RFDLQPGDARCLLATVLAVGRSLLDPFQDLLIIRGPLGKALAPAVADGFGRLEQKETLFGGFPVDARLTGRRLLGREDPVSYALEDPGVIVARIQGVQRELEALLALDAAVAIGGVAAALGEDSANVAGKAEGWRILRAFNPDAGRCRLLAHRGFQIEFPVRPRHNSPGLVQGSEFGIGEGETSLAEHIAFETIGKRPQDDESLRRTGTG